MITLIGIILTVFSIYIRNTELFRYENMDFRFIHYRYCGACRQIKNCQKLKFCKT